MASMSPAGTGMTKQRALGVGKGHPDAAGPDEPAPAHFVLPHRGRAIAFLALAAAGSCALAVLAWLLLRSGAVDYRAPLGQLVLFAGLLLLAAYVGLGLATWTMASHDQGLMAAGRMDPAGRTLTRSGKCVAMVLIVATAVLFLSVLVLILTGIQPLELAIPAPPE